MFSRAKAIVKDSQYWKGGAYIMHMQYIFLPSVEIFGASNQMNYYKSRKKSIK